MAYASQVDCIQVSFGAPGHFSPTAGRLEEGRIRTRARCHVHIDYAPRSALQHVVHVKTGDCGV